MISKNVLLIVPGDGKQRSRKILLPSLIRTLIPLGIMGLTLLFGVIFTDNMYQRQCIRQQQPQVAYVSEIEKQLVDKEGEISELKGQLENINDTIDTITDLQNKIVSMLDDEGVTVATLSPAQQQISASTPEADNTPNTEATDGGDTSTDRPSTNSASTENISDDNPPADNKSSTDTAPAREYTPADINKAITSDKIHSLDEAYEQAQIYLSTMESYYDDVLTAYEEKQRHIPSILPVHGTISSSFGNRNDPFISEITEFHNGIDLMVPTGTTVKAPADGVVLSAAYEGGWGNRIRIDHGYGIVTFYAHLSQMNVHAGQKIKCGDNIGASGNTGRSTGSHLHYGATVNNRPVDPLLFLTPTDMTISGNRT